MAADAKVRQLAILRNTGDTHLAVVTYERLLHRGRFIFHETALFVGVLAIRCQRLRNY